MKHLMALTLILACASPARAFTLNNNVEAAFEESEVTVSVADHACSNIGVDRNEVLQMVGEAMDQYWNTVPTSRLRLKKGSLKSVSSDFQTGQICQSGASTSCSPTSALKVKSDILVTCNNNADNFSSDQVLALAVPNNIKEEYIRGAIVALNDRAGTAFSTLSRSEMVSVIAHEVGHAIGLGHSPVKDALMHYQNNSFREKLGWDDIDGVTYLYPKAQPVSCGTWTDIQTLNSGPWVLSALLFLSFCLAMWRNWRRLWALGS